MHRPRKTGRPAPPGRDGPVPPPVAGRPGAVTDAAEAGRRTSRPPPRPGPEAPVTNAAGTVARGAAAPTPTNRKTRRTSVESRTHSRWKARKADRAAGRPPASASRASAGPAYRTAPISSGAATSAGTSPSLPRQPVKVSSSAAVGDSCRNPRRSPSPYTVAGTRAMARAGQDSPTAASARVRSPVCTPCPWGSASAICATACRVPSAPVANAHSRSRSSARETTEIIPKKETPAATRATCLPCRPSRTSRTSTRSAPRPVCATPVGTDRSSTSAMRRMSALR